MLIARSHSPTEPQRERGGGLLWSNRGWDELHTERERERHYPVMWRRGGREERRGEERRGEGGEERGGEGGEEGMSHPAPSGCVILREAGLLISLSRADTTEQNLGRLARSFCQQSSIRACRATGQSGGGGSRKSCSIAFITYRHTGRK